MALNLPLNFYMERKKELLRLIAAFILALTLGFVLSEWMNQNLAGTPWDTGRATDDRPLNPLPFDQSDEGAPHDNTHQTPDEAPSPTRPLIRPEPKKLITQSPVITTAQNTSGASPTALSPQDKALLLDKNEFTDNEKPVEKEDDENFFETEFDLDHLVHKSEQSDAEKAFAENMGRILEAQNKLQPSQDSLSDLNRYRVDHSDTQRFAIKLQLPDSDKESLQLKLQYREAPQFGASQELPELILPQVQAEEEGFIKVERSRTSESPWSNFESGSQRSSGF